MFGDRNVDLDEIAAGWSPARRALRDLVAARAALDDLEGHLVALARDELWSWWSIGRDLGITASSAYRRHRENDPRRAELDAERRFRAPPDYSKPTIPRF